MKDYLLKMKNICDNLAACGPVPEEDQILSILAGLGSEFEPTLAVLTSKIESYNIQTASALLLASENRTLQQLAVNEPPMSANIAFIPKRTGTIPLEISFPPRMAVDRITMVVVEGGEVELL